MLPLIIYDFARSWIRSLLGRPSAPISSRLGANSIWTIVEHVALWKEAGAQPLTAAPRANTGWDKEMNSRPPPPARA